jgi:hypothetical protein
MLKVLGIDPNSPQAVHQGRPRVAQAASTNAALRNKGLTGTMMCGIHRENR